MADATHDAALHGSALRNRYDVIVLGGGLAGHCAALAAAEEGAHVALLEKTQQIGGSSSLSGGSLAFGGTEDQAKAGIADSPEKLRDDLIKAGKGHSDVALVDAYVERQLDTFAWLKRLGVDFKRVSLSSSQSAPRSHSVDPKAMMATLNEQLRRRHGIDFAPGARGTHLRTDSGERVTGIAVEMSGCPDIQIDGGVVIATGGFVRSQALVRRYAPALTGILGMGGPGNDGDGIEMALEAGAGVRDMEFIKGTFGAILDRYPDTEIGERSMLLMAMYRGGIIVNLNGERFINESLSYKLIGDACLKQPKTVGFQIFDQPIMDQSTDTPSMNDFKAAYRRGLVVKAETPEDLARALGIDPSRLAATVAAYNRDISGDGDKRFGRRTLSSTFGSAVPIETPPFYAVPCTTALIATYCGITVNPGMQVIRQGGKVIEGLYAAGEVTGGFHGETYLSGSSLAKSAIFGRVAGRNCAQYALARPSAPG